MNLVDKYLNYYKEYDKKKSIESDNKNDNKNDTKYSSLEKEQKSKPKNLSAEQIKKRMQNEILKEKEDKQKKIKEQIKKDYEMMNKRQEQNIGYHSKTSHLDMSRNGASNNRASVNDLLRLK